MDRNELCEETGRNIRSLRLARGMSQQVLADLIGIHRITLSKMECGVHLPDFDIVCKIADAFRVTVDDLRKKSSILS